MNLAKIATTFAAVLLASQTTFAGEWQADRLRGTVLTMVDDTWIPISIGDVIEDSRIIRTGANGHVTFRSGEQVLEMRPNSQIQISAMQGRDYTWVLHSGGEITADVEALDVEHFGIRTHHMVAVVKGTRFTVFADENGGDVSVERGTVSVTESERGLSVAINAGQRAYGGSGSLQVEGSGELPTVADAAGRPVVVPIGAQSNSMPNSSGVPDNPGNAPGRASEAPGSAGNAPGQSGAAPGNSGNAPGNSGNAPGRAGEAPGNSGNASGLSGDALGNSGNAPGNGAGRG